VPTIECKVYVMSVGVHPLEGVSLVVHPLGVSISLHPLKGVSVTTHTTAQGKLFPRGGVQHMQGALLPLQLDTLGTSGTVGQVDLGNGRDPLELFMAKVTEVGGAETEEHCHRATIAALILQEVSPMLGTHLGPGHIGASTTHQLRGVKVVPAPHGLITAGLSPIVGLPTLGTDIVGVSLHGMACRVLVEASPYGGDSGGCGQALVLQAHTGLAFHLLPESSYRLQQCPKGSMFYGSLAYGAQREAEGDACTHIALGENCPGAVQVEHMGACQLYSRGSHQGISEAHHAHVISVLLQMGGGA